MMDRSAVQLGRISSFGSETGEGERECAPA